MTGARLHETNLSERSGTFPKRRVPPQTQFSKVTPDSGFFATAILALGGAKDDF
jgi:hypothetical protein